MATQLPVDRQTFGGDNEEVGQRYTPGNGGILMRLVEITDDRYVLEGGSWAMGGHETVHLPRSERLCEQGWMLYRI
jgi:hypothetical protein